MKIRIVKNNYDKIQSILDRIEKRAYARTLNEAKKIYKSVEYLSDKLDRHSIPKHKRHLLVWGIDPNAQKFPRTYKYIPISTVFNIAYNKKGEPLLTHIARDTACEKEYSWRASSDDNREIAKEMFYNAFNI